MKFNITYITEDGKIKDYHEQPCHNIETLSNNIKDYFEYNYNNKKENAYIIYNDEIGSIKRIMQNKIIGFELEEV